MDNFTIEQQLNYLREKLYVESLSKIEKNSKWIDEFKQPFAGDGIEHFLKVDAWEADAKGETKVFLIRNKESGQIAFYFSINCGLLYEDYSIYKLTDEEEAVVRKYVEAKAMLEEASGDDVIKANDLLNDALGEMDRLNDEPSEVQKLLDIAERKFGKKNDPEVNEKHVVPVEKTFPAIDIKFFCRNKMYEPKIKLDFSFGVFAFWEMIVPHIIEVSGKVGCEYVYLFAADRTDDLEDRCKLPDVPMYSQDYQEDDEEEVKERENKLVQYYIRNWKFKHVTENKILKPRYETGCITLVQRISDLKKNKERIWKDIDTVSEQEELSQKE